MPLTRSTPQFQTKSHSAPWSSAAIPTSKLKNRSTPRRSAHFASSPLKKPCRRCDHSPIARPRSSHQSHHRDDSARDETTLVDECDRYTDDPERENQGASSSDDTFFHWEEEQTLLSELMGEEQKQTDDEQLIALAESLKAPFEEEGKILKKEIADTFVPAVNHVKALYRVLEERVDTSFGQGIVLFNRACKQIEETAFREHAQLEDAYRLNQKHIEDLFDQLQQEYAYRDQLWLNIEKTVDEIVDPVLENLKDTPARVERTIAKLEKHAKSLEKDVADPAVTEKAFKNFLSKLT